MRWYVEGMHYIFERDNFIIKWGRLKQSVSAEVSIDLIGLAGVPNLRASFDRYQLGWMTRPKV